MSHGAWYPPSLSVQRLNVLMYRQVKAGLDFRACGRWSQCTSKVQALFSVLETVRSISDGLWRRLPQRARVSPPLWLYQDKGTQPILFNEIFDQWHMSISSSKEITACSLFNEVQVSTIRELTNALSKIIFEEHSYDRQVTKAGLEPGPIWTLLSFLLYKGISMSLSRRSYKSWA